MNVYSNDLFCEAVKSAYFPDREVENTLFELQGQLWKLPAINSTKAIVTDSFASKFIDFYEPVNQPQTLTHAEVKKIKWIPHAAHGLVSTNQWFDRQLSQIYEPSPTIIWHNFKSWDEYICDRNVNRYARRRRRRLEKEIGSPTFLFDDPRPETMEICMQWKSKQYIKSGIVDLFAHTQHIRLLQELANNKLLLVSSFGVGDRLLAVHIGMLNSGRLYYWVPAYDPTYSQYAPGKLLLLSLLEESFNRNHQEFDFLIGGESYKWDYATHVRLISDIGSRPLSAKINRFIEAQRRSILTHFPQLKGSLKNIRQHKYLNSWRK